MRSAALPFEQIEQGIKNAIAALNRPYLKVIKTYGGEFDFKDERDFAQVVNQFPAVFVTFEGALTPVRQGRTLKLPLRYVVVVCARSLRTEEAARHGAKAGDSLLTVGSLQLLRDQLQALQGNTFDLDITPFEAGAIKTVFNTQTQGEAVSVYAQTWQTSVRISDMYPEDEVADWLECVQVDYVPVNHDGTPNKTVTIEDVVVLKTAAVGNEHG